MCGRNARAIKDDEAMVYNIINSFFFLVLRIHRYVFLSDAEK